jgi:hypothetical protein
MENAENMNVHVVLDEINDTVVAIQQDSNVTLRQSISAAPLGMVYERLSKLINPLNRLGCSTWVVGRNIFVDVA